jgi:hypothetical protein
MQPFRASAICRFMRASVLSLLPIAMAWMLSGCTLLPLKNLQPVIAPPAPVVAADLGLPVTCKTKDTLLLGEPGSFHYVLPGDDGTFPKNFEDYRTQLRDRARQTLGTDLANDPVMRVLVDLFASASGEAQLDAQIADNTLDPGSDGARIAAERASILRQSSAPKLKRKELNNFLNNFFGLQLKHGAADFIDVYPDARVGSLRGTHLPDLRGNPLPDPTHAKAALKAYFKHYYDGTFTDRMGNTLASPQLPQFPSAGPVSISVTDGEIMDAENVLLEWVIDTLDRSTPVMVYTDPSGAVTYYPGGAGTSEPTALAIGYVPSVQIPLTSYCGINKNNVWVLKDLANDAGVQVGAIDGLVINTWGGFSGGWSLGPVVLGNISVGDNQTLSDLLKTLASEVALRLTLCTSYSLLRHIKFNPPNLPPG